MKKLYSTLLICLGILVWMSCTDDKNLGEITDSSQPIEPGTYIVGINLGLETPLTKGVTSNLTFDEVYESDVIYLHKIVNGEEAKCIEIPVRSYDCQNPNAMGQCEGFIYQIEKEENGTITITAVDAATREPIEGRSMTVNEDDSFYFSSIPTRNWSVPAGNQESYNPPTETMASTNELYKRQKENNVEIYRSVDNFEGISDLISSAGDLELERKCSGFSFQALFIDMDENGIIEDPFEGDNKSELTGQEFMQVMKDTPYNWYIKVYIGSMFTSQYDMQDETGSQDKGGFYASSDRTFYTQNEVDNGYYTPFRSAGNGNQQYQLEGWGYNSYPDNYLFSPTNGDYADDLILYVYIKHWTGEGDPTDDWLSSDEGAMYTQITGSDVMSTIVQDGVFYECGATIDIRELYAAAVANDLITESSTSTVNALSKSVSNGAPKKFTLHNAKTFIRY